MEDKVEVTDPQVQQEELEVYKEKIELIDLDENDDEIIECNYKNEEDLLLEKIQPNLLPQNLPSPPSTNKLTVSEMRNIISNNPDYVKAYKSKFGRTHNKAKKTDLIIFMKSINYNTNTPPNNINILIRESEESVEPIKNSEIPIKEEINKISTQGNEYYNNVKEDLDKLKNPKKINENLKKIPEVEEQQQEEDDRDEEEIEEELKEKKEHLNDVNYRIDLYLERFPWLKSQVFINNRNDPEELLKEIENKVSMRNMSSMITSNFFLASYQIENYVDNNYRDYVKMRGFTYQLERSEAFKDCLAELQIKYASKFAAIMCPEYRLALILSQTLLSVHMLNEQEEERENIKKKDVNVNDYKKYDDL